MYQSPLAAAHLLVMQRLLDHRREVASSASEVRGDGVERLVPANVELETVPWGVVEEGVRWMRPWLPRIRIQLSWREKNPDSDPTPEPT